MATAIEIVEKLRAGEEVIINNKYLFILMQQIEAHAQGDLIIKFEAYDKNHKKLTI